MEEIMDNIDEIDEQDADKQDIVFDINIFRYLISKVNNEYNKFDKDLNRILLNIDDYHYLIYNKKWMDDFEALKKNNSSFNYISQIMQVIIRRRRLHTNKSLNGYIDDDYLSKLALSISQNILISNKNDSKCKNINTYNKDQFISSKSNHSCRLFRIPKIYELKSGEIFNEFDFLYFYLKNANIIEIIDPYIIAPEHNSSIDTITSILKQINNDFEVKFYLDIETENSEKYDKFCSELKKPFPKISILDPEKYNHKHNHDRYIIINKDKYTLRFTASFNNIIKRFNFFSVKKNFNIFIDRGREYEN